MENVKFVVATQISSAVVTISAVMNPAMTASTAKSAKMAEAARLAFVQSAPMKN
jgi:hypothetical protein